MLVATGLTKHYGDTVALDGCDLEVARGRLLGFLGPNGAGKTTAMRAVFGLVALDAGAVTWDGRPVDGDLRAGFGYMPEQRGLYPKMRVADQLVHLARLHGVGRAAAAEAAARWLDELGLGDRAEDPLEALSHGNQQRVQLAAALVHDPVLLVLDEPFSGLDPLGVEAMERVLRARAEAGAAVVFSSHQLDLVQSICDDVTVIAGGRALLSGTLGDLRRASEHRHVEVTFAHAVTWDAAEDLPGAEVRPSSGERVRLLVRAGTDPAAVLAAAQAAGDVEAITYEPPNLSELFREAVRS